MPNSDFEDRLSRIKAGAGHNAAPSSAAEGTKNGRLSRFIGACFAIGAGGQLIRVANVNYDSIRDQYGVAAAAGLGLAGIAIMIFGVVLMIGAVRPARSASVQQSAPAYPISGPGPATRTSAGARLFFSLSGLVMGGLACFFVYVGAAGRQLGVSGQVEAKAANTMALGGVVIAIVLVALALLIGFIGLFVRGLPMRRVPIFFLLGAMALYTSFQTLRIHPSNWPTFMAEVTRQLNDRTVDQAPGSAP
jgi:hypothetical protein